MRKRFELQYGRLGQKKKKEHNSRRDNILHHVRLDLGVQDIANGETPTLLGYIERKQYCQAAQLYQLLLDNAASEVPNRERRQHQANINILLEKKDRQQHNAAQHIAEQERYRAESDAKEIRTITQAQYSPVFNRLQTHSISPLNPEAGQSRGYG